MAHELFEALRKDHDSVKTLFSELERTDKEDLRKNLVTQLRQELVSHMESEERAVYPTLKNVQGAESDIRDSVSEHASAKEQLSILVDTDPADRSFQEKAMQLRELVEHHLDEEERKVFKDLREAKSEDELGRILDGFLDEKKRSLARSLEAH